MAHYGIFEIKIDVMSVKWSLGIFTLESDGVVSVPHYNAAHEMEPENHFKLKDHSPPTGADVAQW